MIRLEEWSVYNGCLVGRVYNHPTMPDGAAILTSQFWQMDTYLSIAKTAHNVYHLGEPQRNEETVCADWEGP